MKKLLILAAMLFIATPFIKAQEPDTVEPSTLPYTSVFDENDKWTLIGGDTEEDNLSPNKWYIDTPTGQSEKMLFYSKDGKTLTYDGTQEGIYVACKVLQLDNSKQIKISFDAKVSSNNVYTPNIMIVAGITTDTNQEEGIILKFEGYDEYIFNVDEEKNFSSIINNSNPNGIMYLVLSCANSTNGSSNSPSTYIKNIKVEAIDNLSLSNNDDRQINFNIYPNPTKQNTIVNVNNIKGKAYLTVTDIQGREVYKQNIFDVQKNIEIPSKDFQTGVYYIRLIGETSTTIRQLIKQ